MKIDPLDPDYVLDEDVGLASQMLRLSAEFAGETERSGGDLVLALRDARFSALLCRHLLQRERERGGRLATILMALVQKHGGEVDVTNYETEALEGLTLIEFVRLEGDGITLNNIRTPPKGMAS